jgi:ferredoxin
MLRSQSHARHEKDVNVDPKRGIKVTIDPRRCIANAKCTTAAPGIYVLDEETGIAVLENEDEATIEQIFAGARACPTQAIIIEQFGRRVFPRILTPMFGEGKDAPDGDEPPAEPGAV